MSSFYTYFLVIIFLNLLDDANKKSAAEEVHFGIACDACNCDPIKGRRFKCITCPDYDLCEPCKMQEIHKDHQIERTGINGKGNADYNYIRY